MPVAMVAMLVDLLLMQLAASALSAECSNSGQPSGQGSCICDKPFTGPRCEALDFGIPHRGAGTPGVFDSPSGFLEVDGVKQATWGGSPMQDPSGKYHMFFSWFKLDDNSTVKSIKWWYNTSVVAHATSNYPDRGYNLKSVLLPPRGRMYFDGSTTHNPTVTQLADGSYALYYIGLNCHNYSEADPCIDHQWIGAAHATDLNGPWERLQSPVLEGAAKSWEGGMVANPAVLQLNNGTFLMAYRGLNDRGVGMATSDSWSGTFTRLNDGVAVLGPDSPAATAVYEDMYMWKAEQSNGLQMILHQERRGSQVGAHAYSADNGQSWTIAGNAYNLTVTTSTSGSITYNRRERPQFLHQNGHVTHMFSGVLESEDGISHTIAVPLAVKSNLHEFTLV